MKVRVTQRYAGVEVRRDLASGAFELETAWGARHTLREWTWGGRRRLIDACCAGNGFDRAAFVEAFDELVFEPAPEPRHRALFACIGLELLGVAERSPRESLDALEAEFARRFGWLPSALAEQSAPTLDRLAQGFGAAVQSTSPSNDWNAIEITPDEPDRS